MRYPEYYVDEDKENGLEEKNSYEYSEHLRFSAHSYRQSIDENSAALREYQQRYSENSNHSGRNNRSSKEEYYRQSGASSKRHERRVNDRGSRGGQADRRSKLQTRTSHTSTNSGSYEKSIALFGVNGITGHYFLQLAVEAGYHVRALILPGFELEDMTENPNLTLIHGTMDDDTKIHRVIRKAAYVVCMLDDCPQALESSSPETKPLPSNYDFVQKLVPLMSQCLACKVLLYQATSNARDTAGSAPMLTSMAKKMALRKSRRELLQEQDRIIKYISKHFHSRDSDSSKNMEQPFQYIITRPSEMVWDRPSKKKLAASKSLPGPFPITNVDLAEFSLNALKMEKLYNTCPYVVQDGM